MKDTKRCFCGFSFYDQQRIQETLEHMAEKGWMLEKTGNNLMWTYKRIEPKKLRFSVTYFPSSSDFDPGPTDDELTKIDYCRQDGWELVASWGNMQIFCSENPDAVPIETEPVTQVENIRQTMKKNVLFPQAVLCATLLLNLAIRFSIWKQDPVGELSNPLSLYSTLMYGVLIFGSLYEIGFHFYWVRKAEAAAQNDGVFLPLQSRPAVSWILIMIAVLLLILSSSTLTEPSGFSMFFVPIIIGIPIMIVIIVNLMKEHLKKQGVSRNVNRIASVSVVVLLTFLFIGLITAFIISSGLYFPDDKGVVGTYEQYGITWKIYNDPLPLEIEDLADVSAQWSKEADHQETFLLSTTEYCQEAVPVDGNDKLTENRLEYTVTEVKHDFLYDFVKKAILNARQDEVYDGYVFTDHYEPVDPSVWNASEVYQLHWSDSIMDTYLICWANRIVEIKFYWEPTPEQIAVTAEKLGENFIDG